MGNPGFQATGSWEGWLGPWALGHELYNPKLWLLPPSAPPIVFCTAHSFLVKVKNKPDAILRGTRPNPKAKLKLAPTGFAPARLQFRRASQASTKIICWSFKHLSTVVVSGSTHNKLYVKSTLLGSHLKFPRYR